MIKQTMAAAAALLGALALASPAQAMGNCASAEQATAVQEFYAEGSGVPWQAQQRGGLDMSEELIASAIPAEKAVGAPAAAFSDVWEAMTAWDNATILVMKGGSVLETSSGIDKGEPSERSSYFNLKYEHPFGGHLRPDLFSSIYAFEMPGEGGTTLRAIGFFDKNGDSVFYVAQPGANPEEGPTEAEIATFDAVKGILEAQPAMCAGM